MELKPHFSNIHKVISEQLEQARSEIIAAIAWFTDRDLFNVLCRKAGSGVKVSLALIGDEINQGPGKLNFQRLIDLGGRVIFLPPGSSAVPTMHHKFCVIDGNTVITGSYNWSQKARRNDENIMVVTEADDDFTAPFLDAFDSLVARVTQGAPVINAEAVRRRLELIRNLILLGEQTDISTHLHKMRPVAESLELTRIITTLDRGEYRSAIEQIDAYLRRTTALVAADVTDIPRLRFALRLLEMQVQGLSDEKTEIERRLLTFNRRYDDVLGDLVQGILKARAELARLRAESRKNESERSEAEAVADEAEETFKAYSEMHEELQSATPLPLLSENEEHEMKSLYRKACFLCHPDKVSADKKEAAESVFIELQAAYKRNDLAGVREIHDIINAGGLPGARSSTLTEAEALKAAIAEMEHAISTLITELKALQASDGVRMMDAAGATESAWQAFLERQREALESQLAKIVADIKAMDI